MKVATLASGSTGNSSIIEYNNTRILVDIGITTKNIEEKLQELDINPGDINAVLITHTHVDHVKGLKTFIKKYKPVVFLSKEMKKELDYVSDYSIYEDENRVGDIEFEVFKTSHDTYSVGFVIKLGNDEIVYITDTGYINSKYYNKLKNKQIYIFESNHDIEMLEQGNYPYHLKQRILSDEGHLSNRDSSYYLSKYLIGPNTKEVILIHLSKENNTEELAINALKEALQKENKSFSNIKVAKEKDTVIVEEAPC